MPARKVSPNSPSRAGALRQPASPPPRPTPACWLGSPSEAAPEKATSAFAPAVSSPPQVEGGGEAMPGACLVLGTRRRANFPPSSKYT